MKTKIEILIETKNFYSEDVNRRAIEDGFCTYETDDGRHCAVGRCIDPSNMKELNYEVKKIGEEDGSLAFRSFMIDLMKEEYRVNDPTFWIELQAFHDFSGNWDDNGLTEIGSDKYGKLLRRYK